MPCIDATGAPALPTPPFPQSCTTAALKAVIAVIPAALLGRLREAGLEGWDAGWLAVASQIDECLGWWR